MIRFSGTIATRHFRTAQALRTIQSEKGFGRISQQNGATFFDFNKGHTMDVKDAIAERGLNDRNYYYSQFRLSQNERDLYVAGESLTGLRR